MAPLSRILSAETAAAHQGLTHALLRSYAFLLAVNTVVGAGLFGVTDNGSLSNSYPTEVTPAGWTFAIWGTYEGAACPRAADLRARGLLDLGQVVSRAVAAQTYVCTSEAPFQPDDATLVAGRAPSNTGAACQADANHRRCHSLRHCAVRLLFSGSCGLHHCSRDARASLFIVADLSTVRRVPLGPIFLLQGGGTAFYALGGAADAGRAAAIGAPWLLTWMLENSWQGCFLTAPMPPASATRGRKLATSLPCAALLVGAHAAMMAAALNLRGSSTAVAASPLGALLVDFATGLNAGWLAAASGIGISLAASHAPTTAIRRLAEPRGAGWLLAALGTYGGCASAYLASSPHSLCVGAGYAAATAWACRGILGRQALAPQVARSARFGIRAVLVGLAAGALKAFSKR